MLSGKPDGRELDQQQELLAYGANPGDAAGIVQRMIEGARLGQRQRPVVQGAGLRQLKTNFVELADLLNRQLRTRTVGRVGPGEKPPGYPIR